VYYIFQDNGSGVILGADGIANPALYYQDPSNFVAGTYFRILQTSVPNYKDSAYALSNSPPDTSDNATIVNGGTGYPAVSGGFAYYETEIMDYRIAFPRLDLTVDGSGHLTAITVRDFGAGNRIGDRILLIAGDNNAVFEYQGLPDGYQEIITSGGPSYIESSGPYGCRRADTGSNPGTTFNIHSDVFEYQYDFTSSDPTAYTGSLFCPVIFKVATAGTPSSGVHNLRYDGGFTFGSPRYHNLCCAVEYTGSDWIPRRGGSGYTTATNVSCYNLSANSLRVLYTVTNEILVSQQSGTSFYDKFNFVALKNRYTFDSSTGTQVRILNTFTDENLQQIIRLESLELFGAGLTSTLVRSGGLYTGAPSGSNIVFQTQRLDQVNPTVDIIVTTGQIDNLRLRTAGIGNQTGDLILVTQQGSGMNAIFLYNNNMQKMDLPPYAPDRDSCSVDRSTDAWLRYSEVMQSATNLFDKQVLIELNPNTTEQPMDNILPYGYVGGGREQPTTANIYRNEYT
jgi:hypothetical protein